MSKTIREQIDIGSYKVELTNTEKVLFPDDGITKGELIEYYRRIAGIMVPHIKGRPLSMHRFPDGIQGEEFYQQEVPDSLPQWVHRIEVKKKGGTATHILGDNEATLAYIANQACITPHVWLSRKENVEKPDQLIFDLDPPGDNFAAAREGATILKEILDEIGLTSFLKTTGSHGLHVVVSLIPAESFASVRSFAQEVAKIMIRREPGKFTTEQRKQKRRNRLFIDTLRNAYGHTAVAPYAVRARKGAPVAAPLAWDELHEPVLNARLYNLRNIFSRLEKTGDPWQGIEHQAQALTAYREPLKSLLQDAKA